jgi:hypothetical protein
MIKESGSLRLFLILAILISILLFNISCTGGPPLKTFIMQSDLASFSFDYNSRFAVKKNIYEEMSSVTLTGPFIKEMKDYTSINIATFVPNKVITNALDMTVAAERNASSFVDYKLLDKSEFTLAGNLAYRIDYMERNIDPVDRGLNQPKIDVYREVRFDTERFTWFVQMTSDSTTAELDKPDFEYILETFKILK